MNKVYITYENSRNGNVTGVYANEYLAKKERDERKDLECIDSFEIKGSKADDWSWDVFDSCKHFNPHLKTIKELIYCLYMLEGCQTGGLGHVVVDEDNFQDNHLISTIKDCENNPDKTESGLVKLICEELLKMNIPQRTLLFSTYHPHNICNSDCENCPITKGDIDTISERSL